MKQTLRIAALLLALLMLLSVFAACGKTPVEDTTEKVDTTEDELSGRKAVKDTVPRNLNYGGDVITFYGRNEIDIHKYEIVCEELLNDTLFDAIHYRNIDVENRLGVKMQAVLQPGGYSDREVWNNILSTSVLTNQHDFDATAFYMSTGSPLAKDNIFYNLHLLTDEFDGGYLNFSKPWWNQVMVDELTVYGAMYFAAGDLLVSEVYQLCTLFYNKDLFDEKYPDVNHNSLYETVKDGKWTIDLLTEYVDGIWDDLNSDGVISDGDVVGFRSAAETDDVGQMDAWVYAMGLDLTEKDAFGEPQFALFNSYTVPAYEKVRKLNAGTNGSFLKRYPTMTSMQYGNTLFEMQPISFGSNMRETSINYGVLPLPKYDEEQADYRTTFTNYASVIAICSNLDEARAREVSAVIELLSAESYKTVTPAYFSKVLKGQYSKDEPDADMFDIILGSSVFTFGIAYSTLSLNGVGGLFRTMSPTYSIQTKIDSNRNLYEQSLKNLLEALEAIS